MPLTDGLATRIAIARNMSVSSGSEPSATGILAKVSERIAQHGVEPQHAGWLIKALHPAAAEVTSGGLPDTSFRCCVRQELRARHAIIAPGDTTYDACVWTVPGDCETVAWAVGPVGTDFGSPAVTWNWRSIQPGTEVTQGEVFPVGTTIPGTPAKTVIPSTAALAWRTSYSSVTIESSAPTTADQGTVVATQFATPIESFCARWTPSWTYLQNMSITEPMFKEEEMVACDPRVYQGLAKDGVYLPLRLTGPSQPYLKPRPCNPTIYRADNAALFNSYKATQVADVLCHKRQVNGGGVYPGSWSTMTNGNSAYDRLNQSVTIFRGLSTSNQLTIKLYMGIEYLPDPDSPVRTFAVNPTVYSPLAIDLYHRMAQELPSAYPSRYNSLGLLAGLLGSVLPKVLPIVAPLVSQGMRAVADMVHRPEPPPHKTVVVRPTMEKQVVAPSKKARKRKKLR